jgi:hypothetical protein
MVKIYIASPYSIGDKQENVNLQLDVAAELLKRGYAPYTPLLTHYQHMRHPREEQDWLKLDFEFLSLCDMLFRIKPIVDGKEVPSSGADAEENLARSLNIPVFTFNSLQELILFLDNNLFDSVDSEDSYKV